MFWDSLKQRDPEKGESAVELNVLSIQIDTLFDNYLTTFLPKLEEKPPTTGDIYSAFPELPEAGLRTQVF